MEREPQKRKFDHKTLPRKSPYIQEPVRSGISQQCQRNERGPSVFALSASQVRPHDVFFLDISGEKIEEYKLLDMCQKKGNVRKLLLQHCNLSNSMKTGWKTKGLLERIKEVCPDLEYVDISGCNTSTKDVLLGGKCRNILSRDLRMTIRDYDSHFQQNQTLRDLLSPEKLHRPEVRSQVGRIKEFVENGVPPDCCLAGWSLLHTACAIGDIGVVKFLLGKVKYHRPEEEEWDYNTEFDGESQTFQIVGSPPPCVIALVCHHSQLVELFKNDLRVLYTDTPGVCNFCSRKSNSDSIGYNNRDSESDADSDSIDREVFHCSEHAVCDLFASFLLTQKLLFTEKLSGRVEEVVVADFHNNHCDLYHLVSLLCQLTNCTSKQKLFLFETLLVRSHRGCYSKDCDISEAIKFLLVSGLTTDRKAIDCCEWPWKNIFESDGDIAYLTLVTKTPSILQVLLQKNIIETNQTDEYRKSPLHHILERICEAESTSSIQTACELLLENGADINCQSKYDGSTPLITCIRSGLQSFCSEEFDLTEENSERDDELTEDFQSLQSCNETEELSQSQASGGLLRIVLDIVQFLINRGADVNVRLHNSQTLYHVILNTYQELQDNNITCENRYQISQLATELLNTLCKADSVVSLNSRDQKGNTPLHLLASFQSEAAKNSACILKSMIANGSDIYAVNDAQQTPLHLANEVTIAIALMQSGAPPNAIDKRGNTPLISWIVNNTTVPHLDHDWTKFIKEGKMNPYIANSAGKTVFSCLLANKQFESAKNLVSVVHSINPRELNKEDSNGDTFLHVACRCKDEGVQVVFEHLLKSGAGPNCLNRCRETPLHILCQIYSSSFAPLWGWAIRLIRKYGANPNIEDDSQQTCEGIAQAKVKKFPHLLELLVEPMAQIDLPALLPWVQQSNKHESQLGQVARHENSKQVSKFHYHRQPIGSGAFGFVYTGIGESDGREVAVKRIELQRLDRPEDKREVENLLKLKDCEQVVKYHSYFKDEDFLYILLELMEGNLEELSCPESSQVDLCRDVLSGLSFLHANNVLHRDIKPGNILYKFKPKGKLCLKLADFGLSSKAPLNATRTVINSKTGTR